MGRLKRAKARVGSLLWQKAMSEDEKKNRGGRERQVQE